MQIWIWICAHHWVDGLTEGLTDNNKIKMSEWVVEGQGHEGQGQEVEVKEYVASLIGLYKNNGAVSYIGIYVLLIWSLYLARTHLVGDRFTRNKKECLS